MAIVGNMLKFLIISVTIVTILLPITGCRATASNAETSLHTLLPARRIDPPEAGKNTIYIEVQDQTGQGIDSFLYDEVVDGVEDRGYRLANSFEDAEYVLWATVRIWDKADENFNQLVAGLGGVAGGLATAGVVSEATNNTLLTSGAGVAGGLVTYVIMEKLLMKNIYGMVVDVQLGKKVDGGVEITTDISKESTLDSVQGSPAGSGIDAARQIDNDKSVGTYKETRVRAECEQRIVATAEGTRLRKDDGLDAIRERLRNSLTNMLARAPRG